MTKLKSILIGAFFGTSILAFNQLINFENTNATVFFAYIFISGLLCRIFCVYLSFSFLSFTAIVILAFTTADNDPADPWREVTLIIGPAVICSLFLFGALLGKAFRTEK